MRCSPDCGFAHCFGSTIWLAVDSWHFTARPNPFYHGGTNAQRRRSGRVKMSISTIGTTLASMVLLLVICPCLKLEMRHWHWHAPSATMFQIIGLPTDDGRMIIARSVEHAHLHIHTGLRHEIV